METSADKLIQKYPKIFQDYESNPGRCNWLDVPKGWLPVIDKLCGAIQSYIDNVTKYVDGKPVKTIQVTCTQMKEKFGGLRFYTEGGDDHTDGMIYMAEHLCDNTCQDCGSEQDLGITSGWISVLCRNCVIGHGDRAMNGWKPKKEKL